MTFDGYSFAAKIEEGLKWKVDQLPRKPKLVVILDINNAASLKYTNIKKRLAEKIGVEFVTGEPIRIAEYNIDESVDGIVIQLPFANSQVLIKQIDPKKDVDGLGENSPYKPAAVRAVVEILGSNTDLQNKKVCIIGAKGFVGRKLVQAFPDAVGMDKEDFNVEKIKSAEVIISATGQPALIKPDMVKDGVAAIDLGYPTGDFDPAVADKANFFTPVPGGVGPVTVAMLFQNLLDSTYG